MEGLDMAATNPWVWVIEALLHMQQVDISIIIKLIEGVPEVTAGLGRNAAELLSLRILEDMYACEVRNGNRVVPPPGSQINISTTTLCDDVLRSILHLAPPENLKFNVTHIFELDVPSYVSQKKSSIQDFFLRQLKNGILEGSNPILKELKDGSGLEVPDEDIGISVQGGVCCGIADKNGVAGNTKPKRKLALLTAEDDGILEVNLPVEDENMSLAKRARNIAVAKNCEVATPKPCGTLEESPNKRKSDLLSLPKKRRKFSASFCQQEQLGNSSSRTVEYVDEPLQRETGPEIQYMEESRGKEGHCVVASARLKEHNNVYPSVDLQCQQPVPYVNSAPEKKSGEDDGQVNYSDKAIRGNGCASETGPEIQYMEESRDKEDHCVDASARLKANNNVDPSGDIQCPQQVPYVKSTPENNSGEDDGQVNYSDKAIGGNECALELHAVSENAGGDHVEVNISTEANDTIVGGDNVEVNISTEANDTITPNFQNNVDQGMIEDINMHGDNLEISSDSDEHRTNYEMLKNSFLSSLRMDTQDTVGAQLNSCVKCNKDENLLVCSSSSCHLVVHQECLLSTIEFDRMGNFYCPFCAYSQAISFCQEAKKKFLLGKTVLNDYCVYTAQPDVKRSTERFPVSKKHGSNEIQNINQHIESTNSYDSLNKDTRSPMQPRKLDVQVGEPSKSGPRVEASCERNEKSLSSGPEIIPGKEMCNKMSDKKKLLRQSDSDSLNKDTRSPLLPRKIDVQVGEPSKSGPRVEASCERSEKSLSSDPEIIPGKETRNQMREKKELLRQSDSDTTCAPKCDDTNAEKSFDAEGEKSNASIYHIRARSTGRPIMEPTLQLRRKKLPWTSLEEETLMKGLEKFPSEDGKPIQWKKIFEFGAEVFQQRRNTVDLKDKWRNICKYGQRSKGSS